MLGKYLVSPLMTFDSTVRLCSCPASASASVSKLFTNQYPPAFVSLGVVHGYNIAASTSRKWALDSTAKTHNVVISDGDQKTWESCRQTLSAYGFTNEELDRILGKAFGQIHSPYWGEERKQEVPKFEVVSEILSYLKDLGLTDEDLGKLLTKFPEVLGCSLDNELKANIQILEKEWGIKGKTLRNLLLRNPRALGYNIDCKGDCMAQCTRCWARF